MPVPVPSNCRYLCGRVGCDGLAGCEINPNYDPACEAVSENVRTCSRCTRPEINYCEACNYCDYCCRRNVGCINCLGCNTRLHGNNGACCPNCDCCLECCTCLSCPNCGRSVGQQAICTNCGDCGNCCDCGANGMSVSELEATNTFHKAGIGQYKLNKSKRYIAAEIEVNKLKVLTYREDIRNSVKKWGGGVVCDGSLDDSGFEITTAPASGDLFVKQINEYCDLLKVSQPVVNQKCGLHVHIDARDFGWWEVRRLIMLYAKIEDALFSVVPVSRRDSTYCIRCGAEYLRRLKTGFSPKDCKKKVADAVYHETNTKYHRSQKYNNARYQALNLHSWFHRGTIEIRLFSGTTQASKIINWGTLWASLLDWVNTHQDKNVEALPTDSWEALIAVTPTDALKIWLTQRRDKYSKHPSTLSDEEI